MGNFILNELFEQKAKVYQSKPVKAMRYEKGMETGFVVHFNNRPYTHDGLKFFDTEVEAWDYIKLNPKQYAKVNDELVQMDIEYDAPLPVLHKKVNSPDERVGYLGDCEVGKFVSNESEQYDFFYLDCNTCDNPIWIIQDMDGNIRVWDVDFPESCGETFFGKEDEFVCEKISENEYVKVDM